MTTTVLRGGRLTKAIKKARTNTDVDSAWNYLTKRGFTPDVLNAKGAEFKLTDYVLGSGASEAAHERADKIMEEGGTLGNFIRIPFFNNLTNEGASVLYRTTTEGAFVGMEQWKQNKRNKVRLSDVVNKRVQQPALVTVNEDTIASGNVLTNDSDVDAGTTLQVTQFMAEHGVNADGGFYYHHCANLEITADPEKPSDTRWPTQTQ